MNPPAGNPDYETAWPATKHPEVLAMDATGTRIHHHGWHIWGTVVKPAEGTESWGVYDDQSPPIPVPDSAKVIPGERDLPPAGVLVWKMSRNE